jgi:hypothetical protein
MVQVVVAAQAKLAEMGKLLAGEKAEMDYLHQ